MLSSTLPTNPVLPRMKTLRPRKISAADSGGSAGAKAGGGGVGEGGLCMGNEGL